MTAIKPHHFMDIIKLYGSGLDRFVPDTKYGHDFYRVGNEILDRRILAQLGLHEGDILTAAALCSLLAGQERIVTAVWDIEPAETTLKRSELFRLGCKRYLNL